MIPLSNTSMVNVFFGFDNGLNHCMMTQTEVQWGILARFIDNYSRTQLNSRLYGRENKRTYC